MSPDFERVRKALLLQGEPDRVPMLESSVDIGLKRAILGRPIRSIEDEVEFWMTAGYDHVPIGTGVRYIMDGSTWKAQPGIRIADAERSGRSSTAKYSVLDDEVRERSWSEEGTGMIAGRAEFDSIKWPDPEALDYEAIEKLGGVLPKGAKLFVSMGHIFATVSRLMGFQNFCEKLIEDPDLVARVFEKVGEFQLRAFEKVVAIDAVGVTAHPDDVAYVGGLMVHPNVLRKHVWPWYVEICRMSRDKDKPIIYHSDGDVNRILDDIVETGFNALNPLEPKVMDIVQVKKNYGDRLALVGNIDLVYTLTRGTPAEVDEEVRQRIRDVAPGGGYLVSSANSVTEYVLLENYKAMLEAVFKYGKYPIQV